MLVFIANCRGAVHVLRPGEPRFLKGFLDFHQGGLRVLADFEIALLENGNHPGVIGRGVGDDLFDPQARAISVQ